MKVGILGAGTMAGAVFSHLFILGISVKYYTRAVGTRIFRDTLRLSIRDIFRIFDILA